MKLCQLASGQSFSVTRHAETGFNSDKSFCSIIKFSLSLDWTRSSLDWLV